MKSINLFNQYALIKDVMGGKKTKEKGHYLLVTLQKIKRIRRNIVKLDEMDKVI